MKRICLVRAPNQYKYAVLNVHEEAILTYLCGYLHEIGFDNYEIFDFHLQRDLTFEDLLDKGFTDYVLMFRETGENPHYVKRLANALCEQSDAAVWVYGQTARTDKMAGWSEKVTILKHDEISLCEALQLGKADKTFGAGLTLMPYIHKLPLQPFQIKRAKGIIESTRGCHFGCRFCFINQGKNYPERWQVRPNDEIIADLQTYINMGIRNFIFYDSEFIGKDTSIHAKKIELLERIIDELPPINFKIYCRADTLLQFNQFELLKKAGLVQVFVGAESFYQEDLNTLKKDLLSSDVIKAVNTLKENDIYANLSFIVFNRNTNVESIRQNLTVIEDLLRDKASLLGVPSFTFSFESDWKGKNQAKQALSSNTYVIQDLVQKEQVGNSQVFDADLEPLMEIYRLLSYEWNKKLTYLNLATDHYAKESEEVQKIDEWFEKLPGFCLKQMKENLDYFESGQLTIDSIPHYREKLFNDVRTFYKNLPSEMQDLVTYDTHASELNYAGNIVQVEQDEYWKGAIPA